MISRTEDSSLRNMLENKVINFLLAFPPYSIVPKELIVDAVEKTFQFEGEDEYKKYEFFSYVENKGASHFRDELAKFLSGKISGYDVKSNDLCIFPGASFCINFLSQLTEIPWENGELASLKGKIVVGSPTYFLALPILEKYGTEAVKIDDHGLDIDSLEEKLKNGFEIRAVYTIPSFHNPTSVTLSLERILKLIELSKKYKFIILADEVYQLLPFKTVPYTLPMVTYDYEPFTVFSIGSFSKIFSPAFRVAWVHSKGALRDYLEVTPLLESGGGFCEITSSILENMLKGGYFEKFLDTLVDHYEKQANFIYNEIRKYFPDNSELKFELPKGGIFMWCQMVGKSEEQCDKIFEEIDQSKVILMQGKKAFNSEFAVESYAHQFFRLSYSRIPELEIAEGVKRIATIIKKY